MRRRPAVGYLYITPLVVGVLLFSIYPVIQVVWMSFHEIHLASLRQMTWVGLQNYAELFRIQRPTFSSVLTITALFVGGSVFFHVVIGLLLALMLNATWLKGRTFFRNLYMLPWITSGIMVGYTWSFLFEPRAGILNYMLSLLSLPAQSWTADPTLDLPSIIIANIWRGVPYSLIILTGGLQSINPELNESAIVDGASTTQIFRLITFPLIKSFILLTLILDTGLTFHVFDTIFSMTAGGPMHSTETLAVFMYYQAFKYGKIGLGSSISMVLLTFALIIAIVYMRFFRPGRE